MLQAILGLGSNLGDREANIREALRRLSKIDGVDVVKISSLYETAPVDYVDQPDFLNAACAIATLLKPEKLLAAVKNIESEMGRVKTVDKGPRNIDIDILLYDIVLVNIPELTVPHPALSTRAFFVLPLLEVAPAAELPTGVPVRRLLKDLDISSIRKL